MNGEQEVQDLCQKVLDRCDPYEAELLVLTEHNVLTRFANNAIHQNVAERDQKLYVRLCRDQRSGCASTNRVDDVALDMLVQQARAFADVSPHDPNDPGLTEPMTFPEITGFDQQTADASPEYRAKLVGEVCRNASDKGFNAYGALFIGQNEIGIANSRGLFAYHTGTRADFQTVVMKEESSGFAQGSSRKIEDLLVEDLGNQAIQKAKQGADPRPLDPGEYTVILDPYATQDMIMLLNWHGMGAQSVREGRSWMNDRIGKQVMSDKVSIWDDGLDPCGIPMPFDFDGVPKQRVDIIREGVVMGPVHNRRTAYMDGVESTGHALPPTLPARQHTREAMAMNVFMSPGNSSVEDMIGSTQHGLYITRFWYTRLAHPRDCVVTGMTRDGVFVIENGKIAYAVKNLRFTQSYVEAFANIEAVGKETHLLLYYHSSLPVRIPALKIRGFHFTGSTV